MKETKLLNCPFCGGDAKVAHYSNGWDEWWRIICKGCHISQTGSYKRTEEEAITAWNTRKPMEGIIDYLEEFMEKQYDSYNNAKRTGNIRQMDYSDGCAEGLIEAIEIVKEEGGIE